MAKSIFDMITAQALASYYETLESNRIPFLGEGLFPADKKMGLKLEWIKGYDNLPVALQPSAFDAKPLLRDRGGVSMESTRMPFFREAMRLGEEDRQQLLMFMEANNNAYARQIITRIFDDTKALIDGAMLVPEIMRMGILTTGSFTISSASDSGQAVNYSYNYDPNSTWASKNKLTLTGTDRWSDHANSNPIQDILDVKRDAAKRGINLTRAIIGYGTWLDIMQNAKIRLGMYPLAQQAANVIVTDDQVKTYVESVIKMKIVVYDKMYKDTLQTDQYFYPTSGYCTLIPDGTLGKTWYGTTPEEADLMSGSTLADVRIVNTGVAVSTEKIALPVNIITWVSEIVLPSFENMDKVFNIVY
jgi:hypothetical protein